MRRARIIFLFSFLFLSSMPVAYSQEATIREISLEEFIQEACKNDTVFQEILINQLALQYQKALKLPAGDLVVSTITQYNTFLKIDESEVGNTSSLSKLFPYTGTTIASDYTASVTASTRTISSELDTYISQSIAENAFGRDTRLLDKIVGIEVDVAKYQIIEAYEDYLAALIQSYLDWYAAYKDVETAQNSYNENVKLLKNIKERQRNSIALPIDVNKVNVQVLAKEENLIFLKVRYTEYLNIVKQAMRYKEEAKLRPQDPRLYDNTVIAFDDGYARFCRESRTYKILAFLEKKSSLQVDRDADKILPSIDLRLGYLLEGGDYDLLKSRKTAYGSIALEWPLPGQVERAQYQTSKIAFRRQQLSNQSIYVDLYTKLKNICDAIARERKLIALADIKINLAAAILKDETKNYSYGKVSLNDFIDEINKLEDSKFSKITHTIQLRKLIIEWTRLTDTLVTKDQIKKLTPND